MVVPYIVYAKEMIQDGGWSFQRNQPCDYSVGDLSHISAQPQGREGELEIEFNHIANDSINYAYVMKPQQKLWILKLDELPWLAVLFEYDHILMLGRCYIPRDRVELCIRNPPRFYLMCFSL